MSVLINLYNQIAAGPKIISLNLVREILSSEELNYNFLVIVPDISEYSSLKQTRRVRIVKFPLFKNLFMKVVFRIFLEVILIPLLLFKYQVNRILAFGNFLFSPVKVKKIVLLHHPYLVDDCLFSRLSAYEKFIETLKRVAFRFSLYNVQTVVVQSKYMCSLAVKKWPSQKSKLHIIPNPLSERINRAYIGSIEQVINSRLESMNKSISLLYVSRFYPHKNHQFLLNLSRRLNKAGIKHMIMVTVNPEINGAKTFLDEIVDSNVSIINIGELEQEDLIKYYKETHIFLFPSRSETFGNPLIESMRFALPIIVPSLGYAHSVVGEAGNYYQEDSILGCMQKIIELFYDKHGYKRKSLESFNQYKSYPNVSEWVNQYLALIQ